MKLENMFDITKFTGVAISISPNMISDIIPQKVHNVILKMFISL